MIVEVDEQRISQTDLTRKFNDDNFEVTLESAAGVAIVDRLVAISPPWLTKLVVENRA